MTMLRIGTRGSDLALIQTRHVAGLIRAATGVESEIVIIQTAADQQPDKPIMPDDWPTGGFTSALEKALASSTVDLAVHSLKDLPTTIHRDLVIAAIPEREVVHDLLIARTKEIEQSLRNALVGEHAAQQLCIGTSSPRRAWQAERDLLCQTKPIRGNVPTRIAKLIAGQYDAICLAAAGINRLGLKCDFRIDLPIDRFPTAPGQGALAIETRRGDEAEKIACRINHPPTGMCVRAERTFLSAMQAGCHAPLAAVATLTGKLVRLHVQYRLANNAMFEAVLEKDDPETLARELAQRALNAEQKG
jgi:hydroxymethylbilane synthase